MDPIFKSDRWKNMLKDLSLPDDELIAAEGIRCLMMDSPDPKMIIEDAVFIEVDPVSGEETVCVNRLELVETINAGLGAVGDLVPEEEISTDPNVPDALDLINDIDVFDMVTRICICWDGGAFAEFLGRLYDMFCR